ncbi:MAG: RluA family pseudouridine synthase [Gemmatimonadales bacterium]|nr:RluA family pseudouridine synthase [Gemmatimonadales bacterium]
MKWDLPVIFEDNHLLVVNKPAGLLVQGDRSGDPSLLDVAGQYIRQKYDKPGKVYLGLVHRLDRNVSGVVLLARTSKAAGRLSRQFRDNEARKTYLAIVAGSPPAQEGELRAWLAGTGDSKGVTRAEGRKFPGAKEALLRYETVASGRGNKAGGKAGFSLLEIHPVTGRRHQIRAQLALVGSPLLGDVKYGCPVRLPGRRIALHALQLAMTHPIGDRPMTWKAEPPPDWPWPPQI